MPHSSVLGRSWSVPIQISFSLLLPRPLDYYERFNDRKALILSSLREIIFFDILVKNHGW